MNELLYYPTLYIQLSCNCAIAITKIPLATLSNFTDLPPLFFFENSLDKISIVDT